MKNRKLLLVVSLVLAMTMSLGGTLAYLTDTDADVNVMTLGNVKIVQNEQQRVEKDGEFSSDLEEFEQGKMLLPVTYPEGREADTVTIGDYEIVLSDDEANYVDKIISVTNTGNSDAYIRTLVAVPTGGSAWESTPVDAEDCWLHWNIPEQYKVYGWTLNTPATFVEDINGKGYYVWEFVQTNAVEKDETTFPMVRGFYMDQRVDADDNGYYITYVDGTTKRIEDFKFGENVEILVLSQAVQADGFADAQTALDTAFGPVNSANAKTWFVDELPTAGSPGEDWPNNNPPVATKAATKDDVSAAIQNGDNVSLADDINDPVYPSGVTFDYTISEGQDIIFDLAGKTITDTNKLFKIENGGTLTLIDTVGGGKIYLDGAEQGGDRYGFAVEQGGTLNINGATIEVAKAQGDTPMAAMIYGEGGTVNLNSGKLIVHDTIAVWMLASGNNTPVFNMKGGEIALAPDTNDEYATGVGILGFGQGTGNLNLLGGKMTGKGIAYAPEQSDAKITVNVSDNFTNEVTAVAAN